MGKGGKEWVRVGKSGIFFKCGKGGEGVGDGEKEWYFYLSVGRSGKRGEGVGEYGSD